MTGRPKRVLVSNEFYELYRGEKDFEIPRLIKRAMGWDVAVLVPTGLSRLDEDAGFRFDPETFRRKLGSDGVRVEFFRGWPRVRRTHNKTVPYLIPSPIAYLQAVRRLRPEVIVESIFTTLTPRSHLNHLYARLTGTRRILMDSGDLGRIQRPFPFERGAIQQAAAIFTYSSGGAERIRRKYRLGESPPIHVHYKVLPEGRFHFDESRFDRKRLVVGYVGRLLRAKGFDLFLEVAERLRDTAKFVVAGVNEDGFQMPSLVRYEGVVPNERLASLYSEIDVLVIPDLSAYHSFPTVVQEALLCGSVPCVGSIDRSFIPADKMIAWVDPRHVEGIVLFLAEMARKTRGVVLARRRTLARKAASDVAKSSIWRELQRVVEQPENTPTLSG